MKDNHIKPITVAKKTVILSIMLRNSSAVHHCLEKDLDYGFAVPCNVAYDMITSLGMKLGLYLRAALRSFPYLGSCLSEFINN